MPRSQLASAPHTPKQNKILGALSRAEFERLRPHLEPLPLELGAPIYEDGQQTLYVYFPTNCIISLLNVTQEGESAEIAVVGNEGMVGIASIMGGQELPGRAVVQSAGHAYRLYSEMLRNEFARGTGLHFVLLRYTQALMTQMSQTAVCYRHHTVEQQLSRWLLLSLDRVPSNQLDMTQELIANMLGVRREGVTVAAGKLQEAGMIQYRRGHITVLDRAKLEAHVCECYAVVRKVFDRLLDFVPAD
jgi:CRP-like cAMP-binding protein